MSSFGSCHNQTRTFLGSDDKEDIFDKYKCRKKMQQEANDSIGLNYIFIFLGMISEDIC